MCGCGKGFYLVQLEPLPLSLPNLPEMFRLPLHTFSIKNESQLLIFKCVVLIISFGYTNQSFHCAL